MFRLQPTRHANMIGMVVCDQNTGDRFAFERACKDLFPRGDHAFGIKPCIDDAPTVAVFQRIDVHVIKLHREGHAQPKDAVRNFDGFALGWRRFMWEFDCRQRVFLCDGPWFGFAYGMRSGKGAHRLALASA